MDIQVAPEIQASPALAALISTAGRVVADELGPCAHLVRVSWRVAAEDPTGRLRLLLSAPDITGCELTLAIGDLTGPDERLRHKLHQWCGEMLSALRRTESK